MRRKLVQYGRDGKAIMSCGHSETVARQHKAVGEKRVCTLCTILHEKGLPVPHPPSISDKVGIPPVPQELRREIKWRKDNKDNLPEDILLRWCHEAGLKPTLNFNGIPGVPLLAFPDVKMAVYLHRNVWGGFKYRVYANMPKVWHDKIQRNVRARIDAKKAAFALGWATLTYFDADIKDIYRKRIMLKIAQWLRGTGTKAPKRA